MESNFSSVIVAIDIANSDILEPIIGCYFDCFLKMIN